MGLITGRSAQKKRWAQLKHRQTLRSGKTKRHWWNRSTNQTLGAWGTKGGSKCRNNWRKTQDFQNKAGNGKKKDSNRWQSQEEVFALLFGLSCVLAVHLLCESLPVQLFIYTHFLCYLLAEALLFASATFDLLKCHRKKVELRIGFFFCSGPGDRKKSGWGWGRGPVSGGGVASVWRVNEQWPYNTSSPKWTKFAL